ncbi:MAG: PH domain-containing protein [Chthoniobacterales bacterium]|nr:PH domain-containing protein [Chthoniobacterales bacterium]
MEFYVYLNGATRGPLSEERVQTLLADGVLQPSDLAADQPDGEWKALADFRRFHAIAVRAIAAADEATPEPQIPAERSFVTPTASPPPIPPSAARLGLSRLPVDALGSYARATLTPDETPFYKTSLHWVVFMRFAIMALLVFLFIAMPFAIGLQALTGSELGWFALPLPALMMLPPTLAFASSELVVTDRRVLIKTGVVRRQTLELFISRIESIAIDQGVLGRMWDYGTVVIRGTGGSEEVFEAIAHPVEFRNSVQRLQSGHATTR